MLLMLLVGIPRFFFDFTKCCKWLRSTDQLQQRKLIKSVDQISVEKNGRFHGTVSRQANPSRGTQSVLASPQLGAE